jgi:hypothetical protein
MTGQPVTAFSYPFGSHSDLVTEIARESGFLTAATRSSGRATANHDPIRLPSNFFGVEFYKSMVNSLPGPPWRGHTPM